MPYFKSKFDINYKFAIELRNNVYRKLYFKLHLSIKKNIFSGDNTKQQRITKEREFCSRYNLSQKQLMEMSDLIKVDFI